MKKCTHCKQIKSKAVFPKNKVTKDGFHNECKECTKRYWRDPEKQKYENFILKNIRKITIFIIGHKKLLEVIRDMDTLLMFQ